MRILEFTNMSFRKAWFLKRITVFFLSLAVLLPGIRCQDLGKITGTEILLVALFANASTGEFLNYTANQVAIPQFKRLLAATDELKTSASAYQANQNDNTLSDLQSKWLVARKLFKQSEIFYINRSYFPSNYFHRLDGYILNENSRPTPNDLTVAAATNPSISTVDSYPLTRKGFAALEYFIFDDGNGVHTLAAINVANGNAGRRAYIVSLANVIQLDAQRLLNSWSPSSGNFAEELASGQGSFGGIKDAIDSFINGLVQLEYTNQDVRVGVPAGLTVSGTTQYPTKLESVYSDTAYQDLLSSLEGLELVYFGNPGDREAKSLSYLVQFQNSALDARVKTKISTLKSLIQGRIDASATLKSDLVTNLSFVNTEIYSRFRELRIIFATEIIGILGANALPSNSDGD
ncbi:imelysin family protein [Leptospira interrogans]|uniref:imelysin family protein n=1 Tax=Leptospira interrogans TaxID=173 RepID=UPI000297C00D|nr:imelysin family protein [Leptospira interrogans]EKR27949.1 imelysin [Leptospira interrogans serovar Bataviae str. L1111]EKR36286.1 imelysin [Leptospira interrogans serovar Hebdomadis str. R499]EMN53398.1 imelysin [Leptospira interrogans serovar Autumnalis str. LP101]KGE27832.1 imelysin [Leptospira interrogans serovar Lai]ULG76974.1 imelysin family protein [Leptospira interrogans]